MNEDMYIAKLERQMTEARGELAAMESSQHALQKALAEAQQARDDARHALAEAAQLINCAGPVAHRIQILKQEHTRQIENIKGQRDTLHGLLREVLRDYIQITDPMFERITAALKEAE